MKLSYQSVFSAILLFVSSASLIGCQSTNAPPADLTLLDNAPFKVLPVESQKEIFTLDEHIVDTLNQNFKRSEQPELRRAEVIMQFLLDNGDNTLSYMSDANLTASQAYHNLNANCLSLSILAFSLSEYLNLKGQFQKVHVPEYWASSRGYNFLSGHINLKVYEDRAKFIGKNVLHTSPKTLTIDFDPNSRRQAFRTTEITKDRVTAMFYNNKGAINMVEGRKDQAFSYFQAAIEMDSQYSSAWANLAILYRLSGKLKIAEKMYNQALALNSNNNTAKGNLAVLYDMTDRSEQAEQIRAQLYQVRKSNPYYVITLGNEALEQGNAVKAINLYRDALKLDKRLHEGHFALAKAYFALGKLELTKRHLQRALALSQFKHNQLQYRGKLEWLDAVAKN
ncbi:tetratricopeptide repeat protein [Pseudoalteromonas luteoviolacea]|uniref:tetratricopeptide repeat protein n=1 Tax=Pseudoalteromonas luteoviolacea TaxID=43657 RepID=UPI001B372DDD|nr:tetratricopeptide repeat protein [Pseudoalteromonas luteoviolacea]MBQ4812378.1 tetratricopeptide repeat protein [Pseudoalteromonas luteoviolacea]